MHTSGRAPDVAPRANAALVTIVTVLLLMTTVATGVALPARAGEPEPGHQGCNNYGIVIQQSVGGDNNNMQCYYQNCYQITGAGSFGAAVAAGYNPDDASAEAQSSAGPECKQGNETAATPVFTSSDTLAL